MGTLHEDLLAFLPCKVTELGNRCRGIPGLFTQVEGQILGNVSERLRCACISLHVTSIIKGLRKICGEELHHLYSSCPNSFPNSALWANVIQDYPRI